VPGKESNMSEQKAAKPFEWINPKQVLVIQFPGIDGKRLVIHATGFDENDQRTYSGIVRKPANLEAIGHDRVEELVKEGSARYITFLEGIVDPAKLKDATDEPISPAGEIAQAAVDFNAEVKKNADTANTARLKSEQSSAAKQPETAGAGPR
jgi:hypothetical protein